MSCNGPVAIILAAGQGKRMKSEKAKVLHEVCGRPMIRYVVEAARGAGARTIVVVVGYAADQVRDALRDEPDVLFATQTEQLGTGHAVKVCRPLLADYQARPWSWSATSPCSGPSRWPTCFARQRARGSGLPAGNRRRSTTRPASAASSATPPAGSCGSSRSATATPEEKAIREVNPSCYVFELPGLWDALDQLGTSNAQHEYYLTDAPELLQAMGRKVMALNVLRARRHPRRQHPPAPRPGRDASCSSGSRTTG